MDTIMKKQRLCVWVLIGILMCSMIRVAKPVEVMASETESAQYEYDRLGRVTKITYQDGSVITYEYDKNGNIVSVGTSVVEQDTGDEENDGEDEEGGLETSSNQASSGSGGGIAKGNKDKEVLQPVKPDMVSEDVAEELMQAVIEMRNLLEAIAEFLEKIFDTINEFIFGRM